MSLGPSADTRIPLGNSGLSVAPLAIEGLTDGTLDAAMRRGAGVIAWSPLARGRLATPPGALSDSPRTDRVIGALEAIARRATPTPCI